MSKFFLALSKLKKSSFIFQGTFYHFVKFSFVGLGNTIIDFSVYFGLTRIFFWFSEHFLWANFIAFFSANLFSFFANKKWTFHIPGKYRWRYYLKFLLVSLFSLLAVQLTLFILVVGLNWWDLIAKIIALAVSVIINFFGTKYWAFK